MFGFLRRSAPRPLTDAIRHAIEKDGMTPVVSDPSRLQMVEVGGRYADRKIMYFRLFDPCSPAQQRLEIRRYKDFDVFPGRILRSGHVERDGTVVLTGSVNTLAAQPAVRTRAGRTVPNLDANVVEAETDTTGKRAAGAPLPGPTA
jgi:hypothetical protein